MRMVKVFPARDASIYAHRGFGAITNDKALIEFAEKVTNGWGNAGWKRTFTTYYLSDYALSHPRADLTDSEFNHLLELQEEAEAAEKAADEAREWRKVGTYGYSDNSVEEVWVDKDGVEKTVMLVWPHGDRC